ncbi:MAG: 2-isopropylmalate synthase [Candidatus Omnitrophica bacterium CG11_big_fil_rev_8_21_14_0_20_64_10]|nr:MAG: 2-isopropylmalate synthase [Candidatus Omnitrophica bacterium CG11_big_fil_rev_8_21_14_0_20_64_10]
MKKDKVIIFDTTLRDGEQCPGASMTPAQKLEVAHQLKRLNVDVIEAGFAVSSPGDFESVQQVAKTITGPVIASLARAVPKDIDAAGQALKPAKRRRIHTFVATSEIHMKYKLKKAEDEIIRLAVAGVKQARKYTDDVEFSPEDAARTRPEFLYKVLEAVIDAGAGTVNIPDTVGWAVPEQFGALIRGIRENVPNIDKAVISVHCHNDLGLSTANSLAAVLSGARQVECTINGIGERAGNASLEEVVMGLKVRQDLFGVETGVKTPEIYRTSRLVSKLTGFLVQPNKAIVGGNAFAHESGIHQHGVLMHKNTYEIMKPEEVGFGESKLVLGKHSGRHAFLQRLKELGFTLDAKQIEETFQRFKVLADKKKEVFDDDLAALAEDQLSEIPQRYQLVYLHVPSGTGVIPTATVKIIGPDGKEVQGTATGDGPVDAAYKAIDKLTGFSGRLTDYVIQSVTSGKDALGEVAVKVERKGRIEHGRAASTDIIEASARAYLSAVNRLLHEPARPRTKQNNP